MNITREVILYVTMTIKLNCNKKSDRKHHFKVKVQKGTKFYQYVSILNMTSEGQAWVANNDITI